MTKEIIISTLREAFPYLESTYGVSKIALFGSFAKGTPKDSSDVDLLVELNRPLGLKFMDMADYLEGKLGRKVDILTRDGLREIRIPQVSKTISDTLEYVCPA